MTPQKAITYFKHRLECGQCGKETTQRSAFEEAIKALEITERLEQAGKFGVVCKPQEYGSKTEAFAEGYKQALSDIRGDAE